MDEALTSLSHGAPRRFDQHLAASDAFHSVTWCWKARSTVCLPQLRLMINLFHRVLCPKDLILIKFMLEAV